MGDPERSATPRPPTPLWVKVFGVAFLVALAVVVLIHLTGGGMRHDMP